MTKWIERKKKIETRERRAYNETGGLRKGKRKVERRRRQTALKEKKDKQT